MICSNSKVLGEDRVFKTIKYWHLPCARSINQTALTLQLSGFNNEYHRVLEKEGLTPVKLAQALAKHSPSSHTRT